MGKPSPHGLTILFARLARATGGSIAPIMGFAMIALVGIMGFAVDIGRGYMVHTRLANALDAAGLAVGARVSTTDFTADAQKYVEANFDGYAGARITKVTAVANATKSQITITGDATMPTAFMHIFGKRTMAVKAASEVVRASPGLELVLALDNTGSMREEMDDLKKASKDLLEIVYGAVDSQKNLYVGVVPFSQSVNVGPARDSWTKTKTYSWHTTSWMGCVEERLAALDMSDTPPSDEATKFPKYYWPDPIAFFFENNPNDWYYMSWSSFRPTYRISENFTDSDYGPNKSCPKPMLGLATSKATVTASIDAMKATGNTHVNIGAAWAWRMLSPKWRGFWGGEMNANQLPLDYNTKGMSKAVVLMTDGANTTSDNSYSAYGFLSDLRLVSSLVNGIVGLANSALDARLAKVCADMKANGIIVYTVAFDNPDAVIKTLLRNCASNADFYFDSGNAAALKTAFKTIGDSLSNLRVSK